MGCQKPYEYTYAMKVKDAGRASEFIKSWIRGVYQGLQTVDDETAKKILSKAGADCAKIYLSVYGRDLSKMTLDEWLKTEVEMGGQVEKKEEYIVYAFTPSKCECLLVEEGIIPLTPKLCSSCFTNWLEYQFQTMTGRKVRAELVESLATGADRCVFRIWLK